MVATDSEDHLHSFRIDMGTCQTIMIYGVVMTCQDRKTYHLLQDWKEEEERNTLVDEPIRDDSIQRIADIYEEAVPMSC